jgi:hypothetical protein
MIIVGFTKNVINLPKILYGSSNVSKYTPHTMVTISVATRREYLIIVKGFLNPNLLNFFFIRPPILLKTSWPMPRGHKNEQYVLPVRNVRIRTARKPAAARVFRS